MATQKDVEELLPAFNGACRLSNDSDVALKFDDGGELRTHRFVLSMWSPVLKEALRMPHDGEVSLPQSNLQAWRIVLGILYHVEVDLEYLELEELKLAVMEADKYEIDVVKRKIEEFFVAHSVALCHLQHQHQQSTASILEWTTFSFRYNLQAVLAQTLPVVKALLLSTADRRDADNWNEWESYLVQFPKNSLVEMMINICKEHREIMCQNAAVIRNTRRTSQMARNSSWSYKSQWERAMRAIEKAGYCIDEAGNLMDRRCGIYDKQMEYPYSQPPKPSRRLPRSGR